MQKELIDQWAFLGRNAIDSMKELGQINAQITQKLAEQQQQILNTCLEASTKEMRLVTETKDPKDLLVNQASLATEYSNKLAEIVRDTNEVLVECKDELTAWAEKGSEAALSTFGNEDKSKR